MSNPIAPAAAGLTIPSSGTALLLQEGARRWAPAARFVRDGDHASPLMGRGTDASGSTSSSTFNSTSSFLSMSVDAATVRHIARLARIAVSEAEVEALAPEL